VKETIKKLNNEEIYQDARIAAGVSRQAIQEIAGEIDENLIPEVTARFNQEHLLPDVAALEFLEEQQPGAASLVLDRAEKIQEKDPPKRTLVGFAKILKKIF
jgi:hypothetical protein